MEGKTEEHEHTFLASRTCDLPLGGVLELEPKLPIPITFAHVQRNGCVYVFTNVVQKCLEKCERTPNKTHVRFTSSRIAFLSGTNASIFDRVQLLELHSLSSLSVCLDHGQEVKRVL
jgi:hypothetical protein